VKSCSNARILPLVLKHRALYFGRNSSLLTSASPNAPGSCQLLLTQWLGRIEMSLQKGVVDLLPRLSHFTPDVSGSRSIATPAADDSMWNLACDERNCHVDQDP
jgi:hypothetical protein